MKRNIVTLLALTHFAVLAQAAPVVPTGTNPQTGQPWANGDTYHLTYITTSTTDATSTDIADYNAFVQTDANAGEMGTVGWFVMGSTATTNAIDNAVITGPVINIFDEGIVAIDASDLWNLNFSSSAHPTTLAGENKNVHFGTVGGGTKHSGYELGATGGSVRIAWSAWTDWATAWRGESTGGQKPLVAISQELTIGGPSRTFRLTIKPNDPVSRFKLEWDSQPGMLYTVRSSTGLSGPISGWTQVEGGIAATPPSNTMNVDPTETTLFYAVEEFPVPPVTLLNADFETNDGGFTVVTTGGTPWSYGDPESPGTGEWVVTTGNAGSAKAWGTNLVGTYAAGTDTSLHSPVIDLTGAVSATLSFARAIDAPVGADPKHTLEVNVIDAATSEKTAVVAPFEDPELNASPWKTVSVAIPAEALGKTVYLEWRFSGNGGDDYLGAYIDDVVVTAVR